MRKCRKIAIVICLAFFGAGFFASNSAFAAMLVGPGGTPSGGCNPGGVYPWWDSCEGVAWRYYDFNNASDMALITNYGGSVSADHNTVHMPGNANSPGATVTGCGAMGGFYHLGYEVYNAMSWAGRQMGSISPRLVKAPYGSGFHTYASSVPGTIPWSEVQSAFKEAKEENNSDANWADSAWFCADSPWDDTDEAEGKFWSRTVAIVPDAEGPDDDVKITIDGNNGRGYRTSSKSTGSRIEISTDKQRTRVVFRHRLNYSDTLHSSEPDTSGVANVRDIDYDAVENDICTDWKIKYTVGGEEQALPSDQTGSGTLCTENKSDNKDTLVSETKSVFVDLEPGQSSTVCQTIEYKPTKYTITWEAESETVNEGTAANPNLVTYTDFTSSVEGNDKKGRSRNCVKISRAKDPEPGDGGGDIVTTQGSANSTIMYAGEGASVSWNSKARSIATRRLKSFQAILYQVSVTESYVANRFDGSARYRGINNTDDLCDYPGKIVTTSGCNKLKDESINSRTATKTYSGDPYSLTQKIVVSDNVGDKYCNTVGFKYEYWYNYRIDKEDDWQKENRDYWFIPKSACRTIAKKPSIAVWNGSLYASGGLRALSAQRYANTAIANATDTSSAKTLYGAWTEYLAVANSKVVKFGSGSSFAKGSDKSSLLENSSMTIANNVSNENELGNASIQASSSKERLLNVLRGQGSDSLPSDWGGMTIGAGDTETKIYEVDGTLNITGNVVNNNSYNYIDEIPQIVIIAKDVNIASDVTRIDAWIIAEGTLNTCVEFASKSTVASITNGATTAKCAKQLIFNGPVIANNIKLNRTYGSEANANIGTNYSGQNNGNAKQQPAEIFNYRADAYLWASAQSEKLGNGLEEAYVKELPPRY